MERRLLLVDDDPAVHETFLGGIAERVQMEIVVASTIEEGMEKFRRCIVQQRIVLCGSVLDFRLNRAGTVTSIPLFAYMCNVAPEFAAQRVSLSSDTPEEDVRRAFEEANVAFPAHFINKGSGMIELLRWLRSLPQ